MDNLHDTHLHLDLYKNINQIVDQIEDEKLSTIAVTNHPDIYMKLSNMINSKYIRVSLGFHPELVGNFLNRTEFFLNQIKNSKYIGEIGLDYTSRNIESKGKQLSFFKNVIKECEKTGKKILSIHSRNAEKDVLDIIGLSNSNTIIMHWYSGSIKVHSEMIRNGYYFSFNYKMLSSKKGISILQKTPLSRVLLESDGPFAYIDGKVYQPSIMKRTLTRMSEIIGINENELHEILYNNFEDITYKKNKDEGNQQNIEL